MKFWNCNIFPLPPLPASPKGEECGSRLNYGCGRKLRDIGSPSLLGKGELFRSINIYKLFNYNNLTPPL
jgi:hypothetical protein